jgi:hypothetical protein
MLSRAQIFVSAAMGFLPEPLEKAVYLLELSNCFTVTLSSRAASSSRGTALNPVIRPAPFVG